MLMALAAIKRASGADSNSRRSIPEHISGACGPKQVRHFIGGLNTKLLESMRLDARRRPSPKISQSDLDIGQITYAVYM